MSKQRMTPRTIPLLIPTLACGLALTLAQPVLADKDKAAGRPELKTQEYGNKTDRRDADEYRKESRERYGDNQSRRHDNRDKDDRDDRDPRDAERPQSQQEHMDSLRDRKTSQERKELDRGSEQGQESREEHSRKWWKFWDR